MTFNQAKETLAISESIIGDDMFGYHQISYNHEVKIKEVILMQLCDVLGPNTAVYAWMHSSTRKTVSNIIRDIQQTVFLPAAIKDSEWLSAAWYSDEWQILDLYGVATSVRRPEGVSHDIR